MLNLSIKRSISQINYKNIFCSNNIQLNKSCILKNIWSVTKRFFNLLPDWRYFVSKTLSALRQFPLREVCSPDIFSRQTLSAMRVKDTFSPETLSVATISALRHLRLRETFSRETLSALRHLRLRETFSWEKLSVRRNFQPREQLGDTFSPETISASRNFQPQNIFSLEKL